MAARGALPQNIAELDRKVGALEDRMFQIKLRSPEDDLDYPDQLREYFLGMTASVDSSDAAPTPQSYELFDMLSKQLDAQLAEWKTIASDVPAELKTLGN